MANDNTDKFEIEDETEFPSLDVALGEVRESYDIEQSRKSNIEVKIGGVVAVNALLISVITAVDTVGIPTAVIISLPALVSTGLGFWRYGRASMQNQVRNLTRSSGTLGGTSRTHKKTSFRTTVRRSSRTT